VVVRAPAVGGRNAHCRAEHNPTNYATRGPVASGNPGSTQCVTSRRPGHTRCDR
jgi:hypothetical protein